MTMARAPKALGDSGSRLPDRGVLNYPASPMRFNCAGIPNMIGISNIPYRSSHVGLFAYC